jgi:hypothetical protein
MFGDSTTRQLWASFAAPFQGNNFERNAKEWSRHYCNKQEHRIHHPKGKFFHEEGWGGPCGVNEITCHVSGYGSGGLLTFDWKHFPYEDYDEWLWSEKGPWIAGFGGENRLPDFLTIQFGLHSCWHASPEGLYSTNLKEMNQSMVSTHLNDIPKLMISIRNAIDNYNSHDKNNLNSNKTIVIIVTSGSSGMAENGTSIDDCVLQFNRAAEKYAHQYGFAVLDRGEIEHRLMHKSVKASSPVLTMDMHLPQPAQNLVSTCLLHLMTCLSNLQDKYLVEKKMSVNNVSFEDFLTSSTVTRTKRRTPPARPLHSPPQ